MATKKKAVKKAPYVIVRCTQAGVHAGFLEKQTKDHLILRDARRIWYWNGAASISEIAVYGLNPNKTGSKIAAVVPTTQLRQSDICEVNACTATGEASVRGAAEWRA